MLLAFDGELDSGERGAQVAPGGDREVDQLLRSAGHERERQPEQECRRARGGGEERAHHLRDSGFRLKRRSGQAPLGMRARGCWIAAIRRLEQRQILAASL